MDVNSESNTQKAPLQVRVYSSQNSRSNLLKTIRSLIREFPAAHSLGFQFAIRSIVTRYRQSLLGLLWAFLPPLATATVWIILNKTNLIKLGWVGVPYPLFVITGTLLWSIFVNSVLMPLQTVQSNKSILVKINFPRESLIVNAFYEILFNAIVGFVIIVIFMFIFKVDISIRCLNFIPGVFIIMILGMSFGLLLLPLAMLYRDIQYLLGSVLQFAMYLTPIVYPKLPFSGAAQLLKLNPVAPILTETRAALLNMNVAVHHWEIWLVIGSSITLFIIGILLQRVTMPTIIERMGS